ncbi:DoxX family membrane protein [Candidatus Woesearchaeota archaeon]|nr:MAG: DoxX family membrane protein [Candidatus Woesearchaeota archaeon]
MNLDSLKKYAPVVLRIALALVFLWFGINQLFFPNDFIGYLPNWAVQDQAGIGNVMHSVVNALPGKAYTLLAINGLVEVLLGIALLMGFFTRISAIILGAHLFIIMISLGYNEIAVRDFGLVFATVAIFLNGPDIWCVDNLLKKRRLAN